MTIPTIKFALKIWILTYSFKNAIRYALEKCMLKIFTITKKTYKISITN